MTAHLSAATLPAELGRRLEGVCDRFEAAWKSRQPPTVENFLAGWEEPGRTVLACELLQLDLFYRRGRGDTCRPADYLARFPTIDTVWLTTVIAETPPPIDTKAPANEPSVQLIRPRVEMAPDTFAPGQTFGDYELIELVARGGMGVVFKARHAKLDRVVALKMILAGQLACAGDIRRFRSEARAAAQLNHPGIVPVYEVGESNGLHYFTMAFVDGASLAGRLRDGPLDPPDAARLVREIAAAVQFAHDNSVVHRDLKPGNVLIDKYRQPKLTDFGLAKRVDGAGDVTGSGNLIGTPSYMAPEQASGATAVGPAVDIYGLGALLFALLTGRPPFQAASVFDTIVQVISTDPPAPTALNSAVPRDLETICLKCLEKAPGRRYSSAAAVGDDLDRFLSGRPILARPVGILEKAYRWYRRRPVIGAMATVLAALLVAVPVLLAGWLAKAEEQARTEVDARQKVQAAEQARTRQLFDALVNEAAARRTSPWVGRRFQALDRIAAARALADELGLPAEDYARLRSEAITALALVDMKASVTGPGWLVGRIPEWCRYVNALDCYLAWEHPDTLLVRRVSDNQIVQRIRVESTGWDANDVWLSLDNRFVSSLVGAKLVVWQVDGAAPRERVRRTDVVFAMFAPDRPEMVVYSRADELVIQPLAGGEAPKAVDMLKVTGQPLPPNYWRLLPGPSRLVAVQGTRCVRVIDMNSGRVTAKFDVPEVVGSMAWSPDGGSLVVTFGEDGAIVSFDLAGGVRRSFKGTPGGPAHVGFNPSGRYLLSANDWTGRCTVLDATTGVPDLRFHATEMTAGDGPHSEPIRWQAAADNVHRVIPLLPNDGLGSRRESAVHPAGRILATPTVRGIVLHDLATGGRLGFLPVPGGCLHPRFDTAGNLFAAADYHAVRWPASAEGNRTRFGPAERLNVPTGETLDISPDGRFVAQAAYKSLAVLDRQTGKLTLLGPQADVRHVAINPGGSLVASFGWNVAGLQVWSTESAKPLGVVGTVIHSVGRFTPDGKQLIVSSDLPQLQLLSMPDCRLVRELGSAGGFGISPDGRYVAVAEAKGTVRLTRIADGSVIARFDAPGDEYINHVTFGPSGRYLVGMNVDRTRQHVWDLWQLRRRLAEMKLDWETEQAPAPVELTEPISVEIPSR